MNKDQKQKKKMVKYWVNHHHIDTIEMKRNSPNYGNDGRAIETLITETITITTRYIYKPEK